MILIWIQLSCTSSVLSSFLRNDGYTKFIQFLEGLLDNDYYRLNLSNPAVRDSLKRCNIKLNVPSKMTTFSGFAEFLFETNIKVWKFYKHE